MLTVLEVLFRRKAVVLTTAALLTAVAVAAAIVLPAYTSEMKFLIRNERSDAKVGPGETGRAESPDEVSDVTVNSEIELLESNDILKEVVRRCQLDNRPTLWTEDPATRFERAIRKLRHDLTATPVRKSSIITVSYSASSPTLSAAVLRTLSGLYLDEHLRVRHVAGAEEFFHAQAERFKHDLAAAQEQLTEFRSVHGFSELPEQKDLSLRALFNTEKQLSDTQAEMAESVHRKDVLQAEIADMRARIVTERKVIPNEYSVERLHTMLAELQNKRTELIHKFLPEDRFVLEINAEISDTAAALEAAKRLTATEVTTDVNPIQQKWEEEIAHSTAVDEGLGARRNALLSALKIERARLEDLNGSTSVSENLELAMKDAETKYLLYVQKQEEARIADSLDQQRIANVAVAEAPLVPRLPRPSLPLILAVGVLAAMLSSAGLAFALEYNSIVFHTPAELEAALEFPVLATSPLKLCRRVL